VILVTVGMQLGFNRLIEAMDRIAPSLGMEVVAQTGRGTYEPQNMQAHASIAPAEFEALVERSHLIVSHAGIGTVLTAQRLGKPIVLFPRRFDQGEHRNDHQLATSRQLQGRPGLLVAFDEAQLAEKIAAGLAIEAGPNLPSKTRTQLTQAVTNFIETGKI
jgi:UDP-N-acetylglucosamine transferase subunit ALG13